MPGSQEYPSASIAFDSHTHRWPGYALNLCSAVAFYFATVMVHLGVQSGPTGPRVYVFARFLTGFIIFGLPYLLRRQPVERGADSIPFIALRSIYNLAAVLCFYQAVATGATGKGNVLNMTYPAFVALIAPWLIGERLNSRKIILVLISVVGVLMNFIDDDFGLQPDNVRPYIWAVASAVTAGVAIVSLRGAALNAPSGEILFWMFLSGTVVLLPTIFTKISQITLIEYPYILGSAALGIAGQWCLTASYRYIDAATGSIVSVTRIPIALLFGVVLLSEEMHLLAWLGALLILLSNVLLAFRTNHEKVGVVGK